MRKNIVSAFEVWMVPRVGVEPTLPKEQDFESSASANFAIWAQIIPKKASNHAKARFPYKGLKFQSNEPIILHDVFYLLFSR